MAIMYCELPYAPAFVNIDCVNAAVQKFKSEFRVHFEKKKNIYNSVFIKEKNYSKNINKNININIFSII